MQEIETDMPTERPVGKYKLGLHHLAQPTLDPKATLEFYVDTMGAEVTHCISSRGWRPGHFDYIHMFLELDSPEEVNRYPDNIAMFYYFGAKTPEEWPRYGTHHSFAADSTAELDAWEQWLRAKGHQIVWRAAYEVMTSIYVWDPNGRFLEIAAQHRPLNEIDADDGKLTAQALVLAADEEAQSIADLWNHKARLIEERDGEIDAPLALICPRVEEFDPIVTKAVEAGAARTDRGHFTLLRSETQLTVERPAAVTEALWWGIGTGGVKGSVAAFDDKRIVIGG